MAFPVARPLVRQRGWILKAVLGLALIGLVGLYGYFVYLTQVWNDFDPDYPAR